MTKNVGNSSSSCMKKKSKVSSQDKEVQPVNKQHVELLGLTVGEVKGQKCSYLHLLCQKLPQIIRFSANFLKCISPRGTGVSMPDSLWRLCYCLLSRTCLLKSSTFNPQTLKSTPNAAHLFKSTLTLETSSPRSKLQPGSERWRSPSQA